MRHSPEIRVLRRDVYPRTEQPNVELVKHHEAFNQRLPELIELAQAAREQAINYRGFKVGCAVFAYNEPEQQYHVYAAGNFRPEKGDRPPRGGEKRCAERNAIETAVSEGTTFIVGIVTVSTETATGDDSKGHAVLHPCQHCQVLISNTEQIDPDNTVFHGVHDHPSVDDPEEKVIIQEEQKPIGQVAQFIAA